jgi:hypothetical protein
VGPLSPQHGACSGCGWKDGLQLWRVAANILNKQPLKRGGGPPAWWLGVGLTTIRRKIDLDPECSNGLEIREYGRRDVTLTTWHPLSAEVGTNFADKRRSLGRYSSLAD